MKWQTHNVLYVVCVFLEGEFHLYRPLICLPCLDSPEASGFLSYSVVTPFLSFPFLTCLVFCFLSSPLPFLFFSFLFFSFRFPHIILCFCGEFWVTFSHLLQTLVPVASCQLWPGWFDYLICSLSQMYLMNAAADLTGRVLQMERETDRPVIFRQHVEW